MDRGVPGESFVSGFPRISPIGGFKIVTFGAKGAKPRGVFTGNVHGSHKWPDTSPASAKSFAPAEHVEGFERTAVVTRPF